MRRSDQRRAAVFALYEREVRGGDPGDVPLFVNEGDRVRVDTRSGEYVSRA